MESVNKNQLSQSLELWENCALTIVLAYTPPLYYPEKSGPKGVSEMEYSPDRRH